MTEELPSGRFVVEGWVNGRLGMTPGYVLIEDGEVAEIGCGDCQVQPDARGIVLTDVVNCHTHCADFGLSIPQGLSLEELVAPPYGLKHRYLRDASREELSRSMAGFSNVAYGTGTAAFVDFREGGEPGCRLLREACSGAVILGRPVSPEFDEVEVEGILSVADGIGISSESDMDHRYIERVADMARDRGKLFAIHASERVREDIDFVLSLDPAFVVHMCEATDSDLLKCAEAEVPVVVCPTSNRYFGKEPPIARAQACGVDLGIGTDNGMLCRPDMVSEAAEFVRVARAQGGDPDGVWRALTLLSGNILYPDGSIPQHRGPGCLAVLLTDSDDAVSAFRQGTPVILPKTKRGR